MLTLEGSPELSHTVDQVVIAKTDFENSGNGNASYYSFTDFNLLQPISVKPLREVKNRDFVDLNSLLPSALYDVTS